MHRHDVNKLPLYPEERTTTRPTAEQIFRLFALTQRSILERDGRDIRIFEPEMTDIQRQILELLGVPLDVYRGR